MLSGDNSILQRATDAKTNTDNAQIKERVQLAYTAAIADGNGILTEPNLRKELTNEFDDDYNLSEDTATNEWVISVNEIERLRVDKGISTPQEPEIATLPTGAGTKPFLPSTAFSQVDGTSLSNGLVITDHKTDDVSDGNEYVWIEVPNKNIEGTSPTFGPDYSNKLPAQITEENLTSEHRTAIKTALITYVETLLNGSTEISNSNRWNDSRMGCTDEYYDGCGIASPTAYNTLYDNMLKSVYNHGGFWIGRYEAGMTGDAGRTNASVSTDGVVPLSKQYLIPIFYVTCSQAQTIATSVPNKGSYNSSLMFGVQWDCVLMYLNKKANVPVADLTSDSKSWGNYTDIANATLTGGKYTQYATMTPSYGMTFNTWHAYTEDLGSIISNKNLNNTNMPQSVLLTTGSLPKTMAKQNIYDLAGNVFEWTLENDSPATGYPCVKRGGTFVHSGSSSASNRYNIDTTGSGYTDRFPCFDLLRLFLSFK